MTCSTYRSIQLFSNLLIFILIILYLQTIECQNALSLAQTKHSCMALKAEDGEGCTCKQTKRYGQPECCCMGLIVSQLPTNLTADVGYLYLHNTSISVITPNFFDKFPSIRELEIDNSAHLEHIDGSSLSVLSKLRKLSVVKCPNLREISGKLLVNNTRIQNVILKNNGLATMPSLRMTDAHHVLLDRIDLSGNKIKFISDSKVRNVKARTVVLSENKLIEISGYAFTESQFLKLKLNNNPDLRSLSVDAFKNMAGLQTLDLSHTSIDTLPINGLKKLKTLILNDVPTLKSLPSVLSFTDLETAHFTYPHHCCLFKYVDDVTMNDNGKYQRNAKEIHKRICDKREQQKVARRRKRETSGIDFLDMLLKEWTDNSTYTGPDDADDDELPPFVEIGAEPCQSIGEEVQKYYSNITCYPQPDALNPCENIVGYPFLRIAVWVVCLAAIVGNIIVWALLGIVYEKRMRMHYLYMINMSVADMVTGIYLAVLAIADAKMSDEYYRHAVWWQTGWGCRAAGFLAVFASELGIISMFLIAFEMSYNTRQSFRGRRLSPKVGVLLMIGGWLFAIIMAILPWFDVSSYSESSVCLPLRAATIFDKSYLIFGLSFNFLAFAAMALSYGFIVKMLKENETREEDRALITKMTVLVVTDLICWFPTLFFGFTATIGFPLLSLSSAKFVLVFFFPINAFANPFLYVFFTEVIQHRVRSKTLPVIRRITTGPLNAASSLSNFYHSQPPGAHRRSRDEPTSPSGMHLAVTQTTSLNSTPRGSDVSRASDGMLFDYDRRASASPRVSFDIPISPTTPRSDRKNRISLLKRIVSSIPEVSDLSEHSSESHHEHVPHPRRKLRSSLNRILALGRRQEGSADSGRGSIASSAGSRDQNERVSLTSNASSILSPLLSPTNSNILILPPEPSKNRRKSTPAIPLLVVSDCS
ncbi:G-protein coupled receptors family 1 profile domain-containing protein [Caenorhabditis elegans]|uniref:G-protein coupled receptors family 1 profile domain-containing protein n=1 Tax=Caenorhabditis elegans TaxID=6239 RepID=G5EG04_CAEEL|nr:G-protein coupled receptors family 1 profile domain-containing protein [Caenorhabditis elegans]AAF82248.1 leucine-rich repeat-containing G protein-coupled receptor [Caenorhabditis elegans]CAA98249.2 G-protein coupled receptors family 1 profile domain-containing protein [Caenorhabditis elegans]|eukprot:NP_505548.1 FSHR (mammalian follicle stimulating hormone receptor) homolog [Caenorhabditis elegans]